MTDFSCRLRQGLSALNLEAIPDDIMGQLAQYAIELDKWGKKINLVAKAPLAQIVETHFLDSLTLLPLISKSGDASSLLDVGSGAGFPGLVMKIVCPELIVTLLEPRQKRAVFLRHVIRTLGVQGVSVVCERLDDGDNFSDVHGHFALITCRALTDIGSFLNMVEDVSPVGGQVVCMKGPQVDEELAVWQQRAPASPFAVVGRHEFELPLSKAARVLVVFEKE